MAEHIIRRGAARRPAPRAEPRPTAELSKQELLGLIHAHDETNLEAELEIVDELPAVVPDASSPRLAHTLRRGAPPGAGSVAAPFAPSAPDDERDDIRTIAMPRLARPASLAVPVPRAASLPSDTERMRELLLAPPRAEPARAATQPRRPPAPVAGRAHQALSITLLLVASVALAAIVALIWSAS